MLRTAVAELLFLALLGRESKLLGRCCTMYTHTRRKVGLGFTGPGPGPRISKALKNLKNLEHETLKPSHNR